MSLIIYIMEIKKSYALHQVGNQLVLCQMSAPDFKMNAVLTADELVLCKDGKTLPKTVGKMPFFVLRQGDTYVLCWEKYSELQIIQQCQEFSVIEDTLLLKKNDCWYRWTSIDGTKNLYELGEKVLSIGPAFMLFDQTDNEFFFMYFEDGTHLKSKSCLGYKVLRKEEIFPNSFLSEELFPDVIKLSTKEGNLFVSIHKKTGPAVAYMHGRTKGNATYQFSFASEAASDLITFTEFINETCKLLCQQGFSVPVGFGGKTFEAATVKERMSKDDIKITVSIRLLHMQEHDVDVEVNLTKLYRKECKPYLVMCHALNYFKQADALKLEKTLNEYSLFVTVDGVTDKIFCKGQDMINHKLSLLSNVQV